MTGVLRSRSEAGATLMFHKDRPMDAMFLDTVEQTVQVNSRDEVYTLLHKMVSAYGLKNAAYMVVNLPHRSHREPNIFVTYSSDWVDHYKKRNFVRSDPVLLQGFGSILPVDWDDLDLSRRPVRNLFGEAREFGVGRQGITLPVRGRFGEQALLTITSDDIDHEWSKKKKLFMRDFQVIAYHIHRMVLRVEEVSEQQVHLAPREIECLKWTAMGKTVQEVAQILGVGRRTARFYLELARHKLDAVNVTHAIAKAVSLNIISGGM